MDVDCLRSGDRTAGGICQAERGVDLESVTEERPEKPMRVVSNGKQLRPGGQKLGAVPSYRSDLEGVSPLTQTGSRFRFGVAGTTSAD